MAADKLTVKQRLWLKNYLDSGNPCTFGNASSAARAAGYKCKNEASFSVIGLENARNLKPHIDRWFEEIGLTDADLKCKLLKLLSARETKFFAHQGTVIETREVDAIETQRRALDMAFKVKGLYAAEKKEHTGKDGKSFMSELAEVMRKIDGKSRGVLPCDQE